jgi:hypothetical protein
MARSIRFCHKVNGALAGEIPITIDFSALKEKYNAASTNDPMLYYSYQITRDDELFYAQFIDHKFDFTQYDYFLECDAG